MGNNGNKVCFRFGYGNGDTISYQILLRQHGGETVSVYSERLDVLRRRPNVEEMV